ncbi:hypothetical protein EHI8A_048510 [Entamoeba histolytica HM-1:IMSS-B]|uniref:Uncharacterized protein n=6 Tax=Entamoeba histolytica TaxID=5759 RepID=C4M223_ENTH1|nr:hypothetical protein EHI_150420 [Entamoeba histolytica HM-1:IMSS]EMD46121.1 Hypothetical protein EHI5A_079430 [Entamoeba histolytica KU27]EMH73895.1 hypothetical protein EHI8A_048510 [Entamoeba histolytica HM-1:IMSS-B]EMS15388.1 hypothetical protein KM1_096110 [Entamoeba histolytica HM-3:IMSS]ENY62861.1 hypothetical protein EHI7A_048960 [Entamoeba histolytica HM-1:IMSS-A]GAT95303.1 hypothetical protein CL6EHI_150420 [Entamoeba histolytica]|eukprot:XP_655823.1 hypothetical protein EHI_150420 [Entamoeba histolytica HM-1:IMSS]
MATSVFTPCKQEFYQILDGYNTLKSPSLSSETVNTTIPSAEIKSNSPKRKRWDKTSREKAVKIGKEMGLSKATRFLQKTPEYKGLCASTLYYWIKSSEHKTSNLPSGL